MLTVWGRRSSANVQKVMWVVGELNLPHQHVPAGGRYGRLNDPEFRAMTPHGLVPVIDDDGATMWESNACVRYLAARYGAGTVWAEDPAVRARADQWMDWAATTFQPDMFGLFWSLWRTPEAKRNPQQIAAFARRLTVHLRLLDAILGTRPYLAGDAFSMGDIPVGVHLYRYFTLPLTRPELPNLAAWYARLCDRDAYRTHVMISYEELRATS